MNQSGTILSQIVACLPKRHFRRLVERYRCEHRVRSFSCWDQFLSMMFAQLTFRESLRDIEACLRPFGSKLYHAGIRGKVSRSTLARANECRDWRLYQDFAQHLIKIARRLYADDGFGVDLANTVYAFDSTTIDLCLTLFPWAPFMEHSLKKKAAVKLHTLLDLRGNIPTFIEISDGKVGDVTMLDKLPVERGAFYILDRGYFDASRLARLNRAGAYFVTRPRANMKFYRVSSQPSPLGSPIRANQIIRLCGTSTKYAYPAPLRRIRFFDTSEQRVLVFLTNHLELPAERIAELYKSRWQIELFFKWIKQNLRIKRFFGYSANAVRTQIWISVATYVLVAILKKRLNLAQPLSEILQVLSVALFEKMPILQAFPHPELATQSDDSPNQLKLFQA